MIYLEQNSELYNNDIRAMLQAFFDNEKVVLTKENTRLSLIVEYISDCDVETQVRNGGYVTFTLEDEAGCHKSRTAVVDFLDKKTARNPLKAALYHLLSEYTGKELPWGSLTGVRPTKIATEMLERGVEEEAIHRVYTDTCLTIPQKADICVEVAKREQELFKDFHYEEEYCIYIGIPFCPTRCLYCSFTSYPIEAYRDKVEDYLKALYKEMEFVAGSKAYRNKRLVAVYVGGGTPSSLSAGQLEALITKLKQKLSINSRYRKNDY